MLLECCSPTCHTCFVCCRTFDRYITEDYSVTLQRDHPNFTCYYDGAPPMVRDLHLCLLFMESLVLNSRLIPWRY